MQETRPLLKTSQGVSIVKWRNQLHIRWMVRKDLSSVREIERECFEYQWSDDDFVQCLRRRNCIGLVAEHEGKVVGYAIYELTKRRILLLNLGIQKEQQRHGFGAEIVQKLIRKLGRNGRTRIMFTVRERNLAAQLFFRKQGFKAVAILHQFYEEANEDAYVMQYRAPVLKKKERAPSRSKTMLPRS